MPRKYFINPYNFVPLGEKPLIEPETDEVGHLWFNKNRKSGKINYTLKFVTPFIIPREQTSGTQEKKGDIRFYTYQKNDEKEYLAIPGSRLRGHILNLMRAINSSPVAQYENKDILKRYVGRHKKGFLIKNTNGDLEIQEVSNEYLIVHEDRTMKDRWDEKEPVCYNHGIQITINPYDPLSPKCTTGTINYRERRSRYKFYLTIDNNDLKRTITGRWVKFPCWSGLDKENKLPDLDGNLMAHRNAWHIVDLNKLGNIYPLSNCLLSSFKKAVEKTAAKIEKNHQGRGDAVRSSLPMKEGLFVYFETDNANNVISLGRHYHYMFWSDIKQKVYNTQKGFTKECIVKDLIGSASDEENGMKSRVWFEMVMGPRKDKVTIERKNLRILSSQPPKSHNFYLKDGDYDCSESRIRGRKFYWHNPYWKDKMWDNEDTEKGEYGFENAFPDLNKKQWSQSDVVIADTNKPIEYKGTIRFFNLTDDELNLLKSTLVGIDNLSYDTDFIKQSSWEKWCHKIGHARPFMGSAYIEITGIELLEFEGDYIPTLSESKLNEEYKQLQYWQKKKIPSNVPNYLKALQRMMRFDGAWDRIEGDYLNRTRMTYPIGQKDVTDLVWDKPDVDDPTTYLWFMKMKEERDGVLPDPADADKRQSLKVWLPQRNDRGGGRGGRSRQQQHTNRRNQRRRR